jgi:uncharacterized protein (TIRG00374 family)
VRGWRGAALSALLAIGLLALALRGVDWGEARATAAQASPAGLALAFGLFSASAQLRAARWRLLLSAGGPVGHWTTFWANMAGYLGNALLPARAGELIRTALIARHTTLPAAFVLATALVERALDAAILVAIALSAVALLGEVPAAVRAAAQSTAVVVAIGVAVLVAAPSFQARLIGILRQSPLLPRLALAVAAQTERFLAGTAPVRDVGRLARFAALAAAIWLLDALAAVSIARALEIEMVLPLALLLLAALGLSSAVPSTPGYVGVYQFVAVTLLGPFGIGASAALVYVVALQAVTYAVVLAWGVPGGWRLGWSRAVKETAVG